MTTYIPETWDERVGSGNSPFYRSACLSIRFLSALCGPFLPYNLAIGSRHDLRTEVSLRDFASESFNPLLRFLFSCPIDHDTGKSWNLGDPTPVFLLFKF